MDSIKIILPFPPSSNTAYPDNPNGKGRIKSSKLRAWLAKAPSLKEFKMDGKCTISYKIFFPDDRIRDGQNFLKVPLDYMVEEGVIPDDNRRILKGEQWIDCGIDRENPRIEITIKEIEQ